MIEDGFKGEFVGADQTGRKVAVKVTREGRSWLLDGPGGLEVAHPCRETVADLRYEVEMVFNLSEVEFQRAK